MSLVNLTDYRPMPRFDGVPWSQARIDGTSDVEAGTWQRITTVEFDELDADPAKPIERNFTIRLTNPATTWLRVVFLDDEGQQDLTDPVPTSSETTKLLATTGDIALRLGRYLSDSEEAQVRSLIATATTNILAAVDKDSDWEPEPDVYAFLNGLCIELVTRGMPNPHALASQSESLGAYSVTQAFSRDIPGSGVMLTDAEELAARRVVYDATTASSKTRSVADDVADMRYGDDIITSDTPPESVEP